MNSHFHPAAARLAAVLLLASVIAACGGGGSDSPTTTPPPTGNVGPTGATVSSPDNNATLVVPAGAVSTPINVTLTPATDGFMADPQIVPGTVYKLDAPMVGLAQAATLSIAVPDSAFAAAADSGRKHAQAIVTAPGLQGCYLRTFDIETGYTFLPSPVPPGTDLPPPTDPNAHSQIVCIYAGVGCPPGFRVGETSVDSLICEVAPLPVPLLARLSPSLVAALLPGKYDNVKKSSSSSLNSVFPGLVGILFDKTPPQISVTTTVTVVGAGMAKVHATFDATDNVGVAQVDFTRGDFAFDNLTRQFTVDNTPLAHFVSPPYVWDSAPMPFDQIFNHHYVMSASDASGNTVKKAFTLQQSTPQISGFTATPSNVPFGGGNVTFKWTVPSGNDGTVFPDSISIDHGVGDVSGLTSTTVPTSVSTPTTFTLTASNTSDPLNPVTLTTMVTVGAEPAPTITSFTATPATLGAGGGSVHLAWTTVNGDTLSIDNNVGPVAGPNGSADVPVTTTKTFTLNATNPNGQAAPATASVVVATVGDRFVDAANGSDAGGCTQPAPCKTIAKAMTVATNGSTVYLADGAYTPATQVNGATIADGVTLSASNAGAATIADNFILTAAGSAVLNGLVFGTTNVTSPTCGGITANSTTGTPTLLLNGVLIKCLGAVSIGGTVTATMQPGALPGGLYTAAMPNGFAAAISVAGTAQLTIQGGIIDGNGVGPSAYGGGFLTAAGNSTLTLSGVTLRNRTGTGIGVSGTATLVVNNHSLIDAVGDADFNCPTGSAIVLSGPGNVTLDHSQISNGSSSAICVSNGTDASSINVTQSTIAHMTNGIAAEIGGGSTAVVTIDQSSFTNNVGSGINWNGFAGSIFTITSSTLTGNGTGISFQGLGGSLMLRSSNVSSNTGAGVSIGQGGATAVSVDLGTQASPGLNTFTGNTNTGLNVGLLSGQTLQAVGNAWNASQQGANASGQYSTALSNYVPVPKTGPQSGKNFGITNAGVTLDL